MFYEKQGGTWTYKDGRPYIRRPGTGWTPIQEGYVKRSGVWTKFFTYDSTPPQAPALTLTEETTAYQSGGQTLRGRHIQVAVRPNVVDTTVRRIRVLVSPTAQPISQYDTSGYIAATDTSYPSEPWSEAYYNGYNNQERLSTVTVTKEWTRNPVDATIVPSGKYFFSAWAEDFSGNWSPGRFSSITLANFTTNFPNQQLRIDPNGGGTITGNDYASPGAGDLQMEASPNKRGLWFYGDQISRPMSQAGNPVIRSAQIWVHRRNDSGLDDARVNLAWHTHENNSTVTSWPGLGGETLGTIAKGEAKWFNIPQSMWGAIENGNLKGFGLNNRQQDQEPGARDFLHVKGFRDVPRSGEVYIVWADES